ncbi:BZ3500_MvSof-1268-A1-R1_Chr11-3g03548 [Microbotryum saponariae]|uniref:BZ3500_MvSof-1268-A1-R1_Chr11-3g03548 protein n=1 Tax=Microbotryum saponariae TaxID=289078 RepID=A0A2X0KS26_9BASI|nr:BZ3500_MvSof-1268-A1-R1_Chr11-3g03548 [Microbotryum saponariae]SDA03557.1 BZ3501_MvSof-1269-A2-R1_Chr11g03125 [Microbotryum saponariae]
MTFRFCAAKKGRGTVSRLQRLSASSTLLEACFCPTYQRFVWTPPALKFQKFRGALDFGERARSRPHLPAGGLRSTELGRAIARATFHNHSFALPLLRSNPSFDTHREVYEHLDLRCHVLPFNRDVDGWTRKRSCGDSAYSTPPSIPPRGGSTSRPGSTTTTPLSNLSDSRDSPSSRRDRDWVPLFVSPSPDSPLVTSTALPSPSPRRQTFGELLPTAPGVGMRRRDSSVMEVMEYHDTLSSLSSSPSRRSSTNATLGSNDMLPISWPGLEPSRGLGTSSTMSSEPGLVGISSSSNASLLQHRKAGGGIDIDVEDGRRRLSRRPSAASSFNMESSDPTNGLAASSVGMQKLPSLTSVLHNTLDGNNGASSSLLKAGLSKLPRKRSSLKGLESPTILGLRQRHPKRSFIRLGGLCFSSKQRSWLPSIPQPMTLFDTFETVSYPIKSHPRTPREDEYAYTTFVDYLTTRLGSHFSYATSARRKRPSHLWLTTATNESVRISAPHLDGFVRALDEGGDSATSKDIEGEEANSFARRMLVTLCRDQGCVEYCREHPRMFCWGGMVPEGQDERKVKLRAIVETLGSRRRLFFVDRSVGSNRLVSGLGSMADQAFTFANRAAMCSFERSDPVPHMGPLADYDMQITDTWKTGALQAGFIFLNPTKHVISLFQRLLDLSRGPDEEDHIWRTTNLLLDPSGARRDTAHVAPPHSPGEDEKLFVERTGAVDDAVDSLYGQAELESGWGGGIDVKVLERKKFRTSTGRLARMEWEREKNEQAVYFHCICCGDLASQSYIAGSLGYHSPTVVYPSLEDDLDAQSKRLHEHRHVVLPSSIPSPLSSSPNGPVSFPQVLRAPHLIGNLTTLQFVMGLLLQAAHDSGRTFVPPLKGTILSSSNLATTHQSQSSTTERYIWRIFPTSFWANHPSHVPGHQVLLTEPHYVSHAIEHLRQTHSSSEAGMTALAEVSDVLWLDFRTMRSYEEMIRVLTRPCFSTTRVVNVEFVEWVQGKEYWGLRDEFKEVEMCEMVEEEGEGCRDICPRKLKEVQEVVGTGL